MPIYEFYCQDCNTIFNFLSSRVNTEKQPDCPKCGKKELDRQVSRFAVIGKAKEEDAADPLAGLDESKMEQAFEGLMREAEGINEEDPRQMAQLMRKFTDKTGISMGEQMEEALSRMESGEDPDQLEQEMGGLLDSDDAFSLDGLKKKIRSGTRLPVHDETLHEL
ncbi:MAG: zinc ribbon domain-containing protein [Candidatus Electrothrix sp. GM3_4]|nr:zinc ribbon domain-containing protein [Candidatus Electrothrix sp. GM3_4]